MAAHMSPALTEATNVLSLAGAYAPFPAHVPVPGTVLPGPAKGFFPTINGDGSALVYSATKDTIYLIRNGSIRTLYSGSPIAAQRWWFAQVGGKVCAGCDGLPPVGGELAANMTPLGGSPPYAAVGAVVNRDYLVLGNLKNEQVDGTVPNRVRWSGIMNPDTWGTNIATGADFEDMHDEGGAVIAITGRSVGLVFQRRAITRMQYTGNPSTVFAFTVLELGRGAVSAGAVCDAGPIVCYRGDDGFFAHDGTQSIPIGAGKVDDWFANNADPGKLQMMRSGYDPVHRCVMWAFAENGQAANSAILSYSLVDSRFTLTRLAMQEIAASGTFATALEGMGKPDLVRLEDRVSWDDGRYVGKAPILSGIDATNTYGTFTGPPLASILTTGDFETAPGKRAFVSGVRPLVDAQGAKISVGEKVQATWNSPNWRAPTGLGVDGVCPQRVDGRYLRFRQTTEAGEPWTRAAGLELELQEAGER
jgi:hypothetical protein